MMSVRRRLAINLLAVFSLLCCQLFVMFSSQLGDRRYLKEASDSPLIVQKTKSAQPTGTGAFATCSNDTAPSAYTGITDDTVTVSCRSFRYRAPVKQIASLVNNNQNETRLLVGVLSNDPERRTNVRSTWKEDLPKGTLFFLVAGEWSDQLETEYNAYSDLIWLDKPEIYRELTYKTGAFVIIAQRYAQHYYTHLFKTDDDSFVNVKELQRALQDPRSDFFGFCYNHRGVPFRPDHKLRKEWKRRFIVSYEEYPEHHTSPYCSGAGYAMSRMFAKCAAHHFPTARNFPFEDVAVGLMAERCGVTPTHTKAIDRELETRRRKKGPPTLVHHRATTLALMQGYHGVARAAVGAA
jgi:hypothetical protein